MTNRETDRNPTVLPPEERLLEDSGMHAAMDKSDHVGALNAAARLIKANADITHALVRAAQGETRHRSIVQQISLGAPGLNPNFSGTPFLPRRTRRQCAGGLSSASTG
jgi:hypothetical protein